MLDRDIEQVKQKANELTIALAILTENKILKAIGVYEKIRAVIHPGNENVAVSISKDCAAITIDKKDVPSLAMCGIALDFSPDYYDTSLKLLANCIRYCRSKGPCQNKLSIVDGPGLSDAAVEQIRGRTSALCPTCILGKIESKRLSYRYSSKSKETPAVTKLIEEIVDEEPMMLLELSKIEFFPTRVMKEILLNKFITAANKLEEELASDEHAHQPQTLPENNQTA